MALRSVGPIDTSVAIKARGAFHQGMFVSSLFSFASFENAIYGADPFGAPLRDAAVFVVEANLPNHKRQNDGERVEKIFPAKLDRLRLQNHGPQPVALLVAKAWDDVADKVAHGKR